MPDYIDESDPPSVPVPPRSCHATMNPIIIYLKILYFQSDTIFEHPMNLRCLATEWISAKKGTEEATAQEVG
jgi:hypothetical protein